MLFTPLHRALGLEPSALTYSMIQDATVQKVVEKGDLDWKQKLPDGRDPGGSAEFAKDVAAMVNGGGGMIVFGVEESRESSAAEKIVPVEDWTDAIERKLRSWAYSMIQPPVHGLEFTSLVDAEGQGSRVVVLQVPVSFETPHFVIKGDSIRAPRRYGAQTVFMSERDIEQAYRTRFEDRRNHERSLSDLLEQTLLGVHPSDRVWLAAAARPVNPRPAYAGRITEYDAKDVLASLMSTNPFLKENAGMEATSLMPKPGYRKWRSTYPDTGSEWSVVDIHDDGSVALAYGGFPLDHIPDFVPSADVHVMDAQFLPAHIVHLARSVAARLDITGDFEVSLTIKPAYTGRLYIRTFDQSGHMTSRDRLAPIYRFHPVTGIIDGSGPVSEALDSVRALALDIVNQGGAKGLGHLHLKDEV
jgi:hypothetical protein